ncbi:MAG TPA: hypothetical protein VN855_00290 [Candidatus Acidoferrum sp.]|nr:hypothetical protein [Candidatus Acidoferrum sp.]
MKDYKAPEEIVQMIGNISNRTDIREVQERQVKEIREYTAKYFDFETKFCEERARSCKDLVLVDFYYAAADRARKRAALIRQGKDCE